MMSEQLRNLSAADSADIAWSGFRFSKAEPRGRVVVLGELNANDMLFLGIHRKCISKLKVKMVFIKKVDLSPVCKIRQSWQCRNPHIGCLLLVRSQLPQGYVVHLEAVCFPIDLRCDLS